MKLVIALIFALLPAAADAAEISVAFTDDHIAVDTNFAGARLTLFGAVTGVENAADTIDIITVVHGPSSRFTIRQLEKKNLIWAPADTHFVEGAPGLYLTQSTRAINDIAPLPDQANYRLGADYLEITAGRPGETALDSASIEHNELYKNAFLTEIEDQGLYRDIVGGVSFKKGALFTVNIELPATTPVGDYGVAVYLYRDGILLGRDNATLTVNKVGVERSIYNLAHQRPVSYGILCVALSLLAGWLAAFAFRKH